MRRNDRSSYISIFANKAGFHWRRSRSRNRNQKRRTSWSSENSVLIPLTTRSFTIKWKLGLSESEAEAEELNQSQSVETCIVIGLSFRFCFRLRQFGFYQIVSDRVISGVGKNGNVLIMINLLFQFRRSWNNILSILLPEHKMMTSFSSPRVRFWGKIQIRISESTNGFCVFLGKSKNGSWIRFSEEKWYTTDAVH